MKLIFLIIIIIFLNVLNLQIKYIEQTIDQKIKQLHKHQSLYNTNLGESIESQHNGFNAFNQTKSRNTQQNAFAKAGLDMKKKAKSQKKPAIKPSSDDTSFKKVDKERIDEEKSETVQESANDLDSI